MAVAEELLFRGLIQAQAGLLVAVGIYAAIQLVESRLRSSWPQRSVASCGEGFSHGEDGLVAPIVAHAVWTVALTLVNSSLCTPRARCVTTWPWPARS